MSVTTITTSQAPDAKPVAINEIVTTNWQVIADVPNYKVPELVFGGSETIEPGVGEIISPLVLCNTTSSTVLERPPTGMIQHKPVVSTTSPSLRIRIPRNTTESSSTF